MRFNNQQLAPAQWETTFVVLCTFRHTKGVQQDGVTAMSWEFFPTREAAGKRAQHMRHVHGDASYSVVTLGDALKLLLG
jgi:hypothetical protein